VYGNLFHILRHVNRVNFAMTLESWVMMTAP